MPQHPAMHRHSQDFTLRQPRTENFPDESISLPSLVNRTVEVDGKEWDTLHHNSNQTGQNTSTNIQLFGRSLFWRTGFPILSPTSQLYWFWSLYVLLMDATYTAFVVPITVGFDASDEVWNWAGYLDFVAGCTFAIELLLGWNVAYVATHKHHTRCGLWAGTSKCTWRNNHTDHPDCQNSQVTKIAGLIAAAVCLISDSPSEGIASGGQTTPHLAGLSHSLVVPGGRLHQLHGLSLGVCCTA